ncbi:lipoprotein [Pontibacter populi]|uniref:Lipoprotein n=1 Tax=Pontibacter populi TaxID=890055 RepID=A0ABV1RU99_9BACT
MRKIYWLFVLVLAFVLSGCGGDDDGTPPIPVIPDTAAPEITINSPQNDQTYLAIGTVLINVWAKDNKDIKAMRLFLADPAGKRKSIDIIGSTGRVGDDIGEYITQFLKLEGSVSGQYTLIVEAEDFNRNVARESVVLNVIAEDLSELDFNTAFTSTGWYEFSSGSDIELDLNEFNFAFYSIVNKNQWDYSIDPAYVNEFGEDFGGHTGLWDTWDTNNNDYLEYSEFQKGMEDLKFFNNWDTDKNGTITKDELADGVGTLWDVNKDNVVTAAEFEQKLLKYFL